jgi:hypothetical protein
MFSVATRFGNRYIYKNNVSSFLEAVRATSKERERIFEPGVCVWRAQLGHDLCPVFSYDEDADEIKREQTKVEIAEEERPYPPARMKPNLSFATEGRANPKGIPYLYLADKQETAMSEVRPWPGATISVGEFKTNKKLRLVDCSVSHEDGFILPQGFSEEEWKLRVWSEIDKAFSEPVIPSDRTSDYVPTQILAELFKSEGFDGIVYKSSLSATGYNMVLFNLEVADLINCFLFKVKSMEFKFAQILGP